MTARRGARELEQDLDRLLEVGSGTDRTAVVLVSLPRRDAELSSSVAAAAGAVPGVEVYDIGGGELVAVGPPAAERRLRAAVGPFRRSGVRCGVAWWPADADDPAVLVDIAARRVGRTDRRLLVRRAAALAAAVVVVGGVTIPLTTDQASTPETEVEVVREVELVMPTSRLRSRVVGTTSSAGIVLRAALAGPPMATPEPAAPTAESGFTTTAARPATAEVSPAPRRPGAARRAGGSVSTARPSGLATQPSPPAPTPSRPAPTPDRPAPQPQPEPEPTRPAAEAQPEPSRPAPQPSQPAPPPPPAEPSDEGRGKGKGQDRGDEGKGEKDTGDDDKGDDDRGGKGRGRD